jgi:hypothetical protein
MMAELSRAREKQVRTHSLQTLVSDDNADRNSRRVSHEHCPLNLRK